MNLRLNILRLIASLNLLFGAGFVLMGMGLGIRVGGLAWLAAAVIMALGCLFIARLIRFLRIPTVADAKDVLTVFSVLFILGMVNEALNLVVPNGTGALKLLSLKADDPDPILLMVSALITWRIYRGLKKFLSDGAFPPATTVKAVAAASR